MGFIEDLKIMQEWLDSGTFGSYGDERKFLRNLCEKSLENAEATEADRAFSRKDILGSSFRSHLPPKYQQQTLKDIADRAMKFYERGVASYQKMVADLGKDTILVPTMNQGRGGANKTTFYLATAPFDGIDLEQSRVDTSIDSTIIYERISADRIKLSWTGRFRYGNGSLERGSARWWIFAAKITFHSAAFGLSLFGTMLVLSMGRGPVTSQQLGIIIGTILIGAALWFFQFKPLNIMINRKMMMVEDHHLQFNERPAQIEKVADPRSPDFSIFKLVRYHATCAICGADVEIQDGGNAFPDRFVGGCRNSPQEHVYSFDRFTMRGKLLRDIP